MISKSKPDKMNKKPGMVVHTLIPVFRKQRQTDLSEFEASLLYRVSSRTARAT